MRIYISGPMTGLKDHNHPEFNRVANELREAGHEVFNPAEIELSEEELERINSIDDEAERALELWKAYMRECIKNLPDYECLVQLDGWILSKGARIEANLAKQLGMEVLHTSKFNAAVGAGYEGN